MFDPNVAQVRKISGLENNSLQVLRKKVIVNGLVLSQLHFLLYLSTQSTLYYLSHSPIHISILHLHSAERIRRISGFTVLPEDTLVYRLMWSGFDRLVD